MGQPVGASMSQGRGEFLLIDARELLAPEVCQRRQRVLVQDAAQGLTAAQKHVWNALHFLLHRRAHGYREGYCSYADIADFCGLAASTIVSAIKALVARDLLLKRRRQDPRGKRGPAHFYAPNAYWLLPPPSVRTKDERVFEDERLPPRRVLQRAVAVKIVTPSVSPVPSPESPPLLAPDAPKGSEAEALVRDQAQRLVADFHRDAGLGSRLGAQELELARELIAQHGLDAVQRLGHYVLMHDKPRSFMLVKFYVARQPHLVADACARSVVEDVLGARIEGLRKRILSLKEAIYAIPNSPLLLAALELDNWCDNFDVLSAYGSDPESVERVRNHADLLETAISDLEIQL